MTNPVCILCKQVQPSEIIFFHHQGTRAEFDLWIKCNDCQGLHHMHCLGFHTLQEVPFQQIFGSQGYRCFMCETLNLDGWRYIGDAPDPVTYPTKTAGLNAIRQFVMPEVPVISEEENGHQSLIGALIHDELDHPKQIEAKRILQENENVKTVAQISKELDDEEHMKISKEMTDEEFMKMIEIYYGHDFGDDFGSSFS